MDYDNTVVSDVDTKTPTQLADDKSLLDQVLLSVLNHVKETGVANDAVGDFLGHDGSWHRYPDGWAEIGLTMVALLNVASTPEQCRSLVPVARKELGDKGAKLVEGWISAPWRVCPVDFGKKIRGSLATVRVLGDLPAFWDTDRYSNEIQLYSPALMRHHDRGERRWLALVAPQFGVFQTFGLLIPVGHFSETDLAAFARFCESESEYRSSNVVPPLAGGKLSSEPLADAITRHIIYFLHLPEYHTLPDESEELEGRALCASVALLHGGPELGDPVYWQTQLLDRFPDLSVVACGSVFGLQIRKRGFPHHAEIVVSSSDRRAFLRTRDIETYELFKNEVGPLVAFPDEPHQRTPLLVWETLYHVVTPVDELQMLDEALSKGVPDAIGAFGLSPDELAQLVGARPPQVPRLMRLLSPEELEPEIEALRQAPIVRLALFLSERALDTGEVPTTAGGYVKPAIVQAALDAGVLDLEPWHTEYYRKHRPAKEIDCVEFHQMRERLEECGFLKTERKKVTLTAVARTLAPEPHLLYHTLLTNAFCEYCWELPVYRQPVVDLRERGALLLYVLRLYAGREREWVETDEIADAYRVSTGAWPVNPEEFFADFNVATGLVHNLGRPFGLVEELNQYFPPEGEEGRNASVRPLALFDQVFEVSEVATGTRR